MNLRRLVAVLPWYDAFSKVGLRYGPQFQLLFNIEACEEGNWAEAEVSLQASHKMELQESRYAVHPSVIDAMLQLALVTIHAGMAYKLKERFLPVSFGRIFVRQPSHKDRESPARLVGTGRRKGMRGMIADVTMTGVHKGVIVEARDMKFLALESVSNIVEGKDLPYMRMNWVPDFEFLTGENVRLLPPAVPDESAIAESLNEPGTPSIDTIPYNLSRIFRKAPKHTTSTEFLRMDGKNN